MEIDDLVSRCMSDVYNTMDQDDSATNSVLSWVSQLAESVSCKSLLESFDLYNADGTVQRVGYDDVGDDADGASDSGVAVGAAGGASSASRADYSGYWR